MPPPDAPPTSAARLTPRRDGPDPSGAVAGQGGRQQLRRERYTRGEKAPREVSNPKAPGEWCETDDDVDETEGRIVASIPD
eukprot:12601247-Alexandrium_andersonii.AAC.1